MCICPKARIYTNAHTYIHTHTHASTFSAAAAASVAGCSCNRGFIGSAEGTACEACPQNTYKPTYGWNATCTPCPGNSSTLQNASISQTDCRCVPGFFGPPGGPCSPCPAGRYQDERGVNTCKQCPRGTVSEEASSRLTQCVCNVGFSANADGVECTICANNTYKNLTGLGSCIPCPAHSSSGSGSISPSSCVCDFDSVGPAGGPCYCKQGYYQNASAPGKCVACKAFSTSEVNSQAASDCLCLPAYEANTADTCSLCPAGKYKSIRNNSACLACPAGTSSVPGSTDILNCTCKVGHERADGAECTQCQLNFYKTTAGAGTCVACPANSVTLANGSSTAASCVCRSGFFYNNTASACSPCPEGTYKAETGQQACTACGANLSSAVGSVAASACDCARGYSGSKATACVACPAGSYKDFIGPGNCTHCPSKSWSGPASGALTACTCTGGAVGLAGGPCECGPGLILNTTADTCEPCPQYTESPNGGTRISECECIPGYTGLGGRAPPPTCACPLNDPWARVHASNWDSATGTLLDTSGFARHSVSSAGTIRTATSTGNGATAPQTYIYGDAAANIVFSTGWLPENFTLCSMTRYNGTTKGRIINALGADFAHGHHATHGRGVAKYNGQWVTAQTGMGNDQDWLVFCGKSTGTAPNNVLANGAPRGVADSAANGLLAQLAINAGDAATSQPSDWAFAHAIVWDRILSDAEMAQVSGMMLKSLNDSAIDLASLPNAPGACNCSAVPACTPCPAGTYKDTFGTGQCLACPENTTSREGSGNLTDCQCVLGHEAPANGLVCSRCPKDTYKDALGNGSCTACPAMSSSWNVVSVFESVVYTCVYTSTSV